MMNKNKKHLPILRYARSDEACLNGGLVPHDAGSGSGSRVKSGSGGRGRFPFGLTRSSLSLRFSLTSIKSDVTMSSSELFSNDDSSLSTFGWNSSGLDDDDTVQTPFDDTTTTEFDRWGACIVSKEGQRKSYPLVNEEGGNGMPAKPIRRRSTGSTDDMPLPLPDSSPRVPGRRVSKLLNDSKATIQSAIIEEDGLFKKEHEPVRTASRKRNEVMGLQSAKRVSFAPGSA